LNRIDPGSVTGRGEPEVHGVLDQAGASRWTAHRTPCGAAVTRKPRQIARLGSRGPSGFAPARDSFDFRFPVLIGPAAPRPTIASRPAGARAGASDGERATRASPRESEGRRRRPGPGRGRTSEAQAEERRVRVDATASTWCASRCRPCGRGGPTSQSWRNTSCVATVRSGPTRPQVSATTRCVRSCCTTTRQRPGAREPHPARGRPGAGAPDHGGGSPGPGGRHVRGRRRGARDGPAGDAPRAGAARAGADTDPARAHPGRGNKAEAARLLQMRRQQLYARLSELGLE
jgi:hypothetical protein